MVRCAPSRTATSKGATARFANALEGLGVERGTRVFCLLGRVPELYVAALGTLKRGAVFAPLFSAFGPEPIQQRMEIGEGRVLVTSPRLYRRKVAPVRDRLPELQHVILVPGADDPIPDGLLGDGVHDWNALTAAASAAYAIAATDPESLALLHFTSGTTGLPKGAMHVHQAAVHHYATGLYALDFHDGDVFWCTADPGWVTGHQLRHPGAAAARHHQRGRRGRVRRRALVPDPAGSAGDRLVHRPHRGPDAHEGRRRRWRRATTCRACASSAASASRSTPRRSSGGTRRFGMPIHDNWWQTETGGIMIANTRAMDVKPGSMGRPLPGIDGRHRGQARRRRRRRGRGPRRRRASWRCAPAGRRCSAATCTARSAYRQAFRDGWYLTGDLAKRDADGYFWFVGRADDLIKSAGHLIGPFEVESALIEHPAVDEAGVIGVPDPVAGEIVKAFVTLAPGFEASEALELELIGHGRKKLGPAVAPKMIEIVDVPAAYPQRQDHAPPAQGARAGPPRGRHVDPRERPRRAEGSRLVSETLPLPSKEHAQHLLRQMIRIRRFEEACAELYQATKIRGFLHLYIGEEAVATGVMEALDERDGIVATYREHGHALLRGMSAESIMAEMYGKQEGCSRGRGGSMHLYDAATRFYGGNAIVAGGLPLAVGLGLAEKLRGPGERGYPVAVCFFGEGAMAEGEFHESMNLAALWDLPVLFCCENNLYAMGTALARYQSETELTLKALASTGCPPGRSTAWTCWRSRRPPTPRSTRSARRRTALPGAAHLPLPRPQHVRPGALPRQGRGRGLEGARPDRHLPGAARGGRPAAPGRPGCHRGGGGRRGPTRDRLRRGRHVGAGERAHPLRDQRTGGGGMSAQAVKLHNGEAHVADAKAVHEAGTSEATKETSYREAVRAAMTEAMEADDRVFLMGEDVGAYGGCYAVSMGLLERFGPERVRDTPLSESAFVGAGIGAAMAGMRPIVEVMTVNFSLLALDQIVNTAATVLHMSGGQCNVPIVIRMATGAGRQLAAQHSHSLEGWYAHIPGLRILAPATIEDARGMLGPALADPDPVLIFENAALYNLKAELADPPPCGRHRVGGGAPRREPTSA